MAAALSPLCPLLPAHVHSQHHSHRIRPAKARRDQPPLCLCIWETEKPLLKKDFFKKNYFKSKHEGRERKRRSKSPQFGALPSGFGMNERHSFQAALELGVCGGKGNDGQHPPATEPQGNQSCCPPAQPCPGRPGGAGGPGARSLPVTGAL